MNKAGRQGVAAVAVALTFGAASAQGESEGASVVKVATPASSANNYVGDKVGFPVAVVGKSKLLGSGDQETDVCIPEGVILRGIGAYTTQVGGVDKLSLRFRVDDPTESGKGCGTRTIAAEGAMVSIDSDLLKNAVPKVLGWTYGTLLVPYKYQFGGDRSLSGGATLGGYLGYRSAKFGNSAAFIAFGGATKVDVARLKDGKPFNESLAGLSYGVGVLGTIKDGFKLGLVIGTDRVARSAEYVNNGKPWISLSLGYDFTGP